MKWPIFPGILSLIATLHAEVPEGAALLDKIISHPGSYSQVCNPMSSPADVPYQAFQISGYKGASLSQANLALIEKNRGILVKAISARLPAIDLSKPAKQPAEDPTPEVNLHGETFGSDPETLNPFLLRVIRLAHATEALPGLLIVEEKLAKGIDGATADTKAAPPVVDGWLAFSDAGVSTAPINWEEIEKAPRNRKEPTPAEIAERDFGIALFNARVAQRDVLMTIALLMREKSFTPYLKTRFEAAYAEGLKAQLAEWGVKDFKPGDPLPPDLAGSTMEIDKITGFPFVEFSPVRIPYSRESRDEIRAAAAQWITEHP